MTRISFGVGTSLVLFHLLAVPAAASPVLSSMVTEFAEGNPTGNGTGSGSVKASACNAIGQGGGCEESFAYANYRHGHASSVIRGTTNGGVNVANSVSQTAITYFFVVSGPPNVLVPLILTANGATSATGASVFSTVQVEWGGGQFYACSGTGSSIASCGTEPASFAGSQHSSVTSQLLSVVQIIVTGSSNLGSGEYVAQTSQPSLVIDPSFSGASQFKLIFSNP